MRTFQHLKDFEERSSFSSWITRITINSALMNLRKKRGYVETSMDVIGEDHASQYRREPKNPTESPESHCSGREREKSYCVEQFNSYHRGSER